MRWQAHAIVVSLYNNSAPAARHCLLAILWSLWRRLPEHGRRAASGQTLDRLSIIRQDANQFHTLNH